MSHVDGVDDGVGYGVSGTSSKGAGQLFVIKKKSNCKIYQL
jgi:hypothetical protein